MKAFSIEETTARKKCTDAGMKFIKFTDTDTAYWYKTCSESSWAEMTKVYPEVAGKLRPLFTKTK
jgi:hypothetical protein